MKWSFTQLIAMIFVFAIAAGVSFTMGAPGLGFAFIFCTLVQCFVTGTKFLAEEVINPR